jgi:type 1 glutamine amidotransferase
MKRALFICGGWAGHKPEQIVHLFSTALAAKGFTPVIETSLDILVDPARLQDFAVIFPCWTMGALTKEQSAGLRVTNHSDVAGSAVFGPK